MAYELQFAETALREWRRLDATVSRLFKKQLEKRLENPHVPSAKLRGSENRYKIKLRAVGYRLVYEVYEDRVVVAVIAVGRRDEVYDLASRR